jgi:hypothetical protein
MFTLLSWLGRFSWPLVGFLLPGMSPRLVMWLAGCLAVLVAVGGPAGAVWIHMRGVVREVRNTERLTRDAEWTRKLQQANHDHERELSEAINAADAVPALAADASLVELCRADDACRDKDRKYRHRVQGVSAN